MRRIIIWLAAASTVFTAQSDIVNGSFTAGEAGRIVNLRSLAQIGKGWYANDFSVRHFKFVNGTVTLNSSEASSKPAMIGQFFTYNGTGERVLKFDAAVTDSNANLDFRVQLYGYKQRTAEKTILFANAIKLESMDPPVTSEYYEVKELVNYTHLHAGTLNSGNVTTQSVTFAASADYAFYGIRIIANRPDAEDKITFDNVSITTVPKPAADVAPEKSAPPPKR